ncbi:hypothetical protein ACIBSV_08535 [Embleya sp. NPDC050154]|uniref:hypothetical protein n=1 Tax=unclassified Embleya TaxID=2699296 RepID=UPI003792CEDA
MSIHRDKRRRRIPIAIAAGAVLALTAGTLSTGTAQAADDNVSVDLAAVQRPVPADTFSADVTGYGYHSYLTVRPPVTPSRLR